MDRFKDKRGRTHVHGFDDGHDSKRQTAADSHDDCKDKMIIGLDTRLTYNDCRSRCSLQVQKDHIEQ